VSPQGLTPIVHSYHTFDVAPPTGPGAPAPLVVAGVENADAHGDIEQQDGALDLEANDPPPLYRRTCPEITLLGSRLLPLYVCSCRHILMWTMGITSVLVIGFMFVYWDTLDRV